MTNSTVKQLVADRLCDLGLESSTSSIPVSLRLDPATVAQLDVISQYLGYRSRSQLLRDVLEHSLEDLILETLSALKHDDTASDEFRSSLVSALGG